ncbi:MAG: CcdB family protein [Labilithrix sp.]
MAQFDVHRNPGQHRERIPYVVVVQSAVFDGYRRRVVVPLVKKADFRTVPHARFNPSFTVKGAAVVLHPLEIVSVPVDKLGKAVASLTAHGGAIIDALDDLLTRVYG